MPYYDHIYAFSVFCKYYPLPPYKKQNPFLLSGRSIHTMNLVRIYNY